MNPYLERLQEYGFITKQRPILSKPGAKNVRWQLKDPFLRFWFRFVHPYAALVEAGRSEEIGEIVFRHFATYSGHLLEEWFRASLMEASDWQEVGSWWQAQRGAGGAQDEIDIVALNFEEHKAFVAEVKRQQKSFEAKKFLTKVEHLKCAALSNWQITTGVLTLKDM